MKGVNCTMAKYKIGEIVASTGISSFTLKFYEREGLLNPYTDEATKYRYYDVPDIGSVVAIHHLRQCGFSVKDVKAILAARSQEEIAALYRRRIEDNAAEIVRLREVERTLEHCLLWQERFLRHRGGWELLEVPPFHFLEHCAASEADLTEQNALIAQRITDGVDSHMAVRVPADRVDSTDPTDAFWGLLRFDEGPEERAQLWAEGLPFPGGTCLAFYAAMPFQPYFNPDCFRDGLTAFREQGLVLAGDVYGLYLSETAEGQGTTENYIFFFPVKKDS